MRLVSQKTPAPRLLSSIVPEPPERPPECVSTRPRLKSGSFFSGNGRAIFLAVILGAVLFSTISVVYVRRQAAQRHAEEEPKLLAVSTHSISPSEPIVVRISADLIHVSAISLGHPRLAIINGQLVGEGEHITIHTPAASIAVSLRVLKIFDGQILLSDGTQVITARLELSPALKRKS
jgi:hypothetical protein